MSLLSFFGGAAKGFTESVEKEEERAREDAKGAITALYQNYKTVTEENRKLSNTLNEDRQLFEATFGKADKDQLEAILYNRPVADMIRKGIEGGKINKDTFDLNQFVTIAKSNPDMAGKAERTQQLIDLPETVQKIKAQYESQPGGLRGFIKSFGEKEYAAAEQAFANRTGRTLEELKSAKRLELKAPAGSTYNMAMFGDKPSSVEEQLRTDQVAAMQAGQKFGKDSVEYKAAVKKVEDTKGYIENADKSPQQRLDRLQIQKMDATDPALKKELDSKITLLQNTIRAEKQATSAKDPDAQQKGYAHVKRSVDNYVNTRMREDTGASWQKYVEYKQTVMPDNTIYVSKTTKQEMPIEEQRKMFADERRLAIDALKTNGYMSPDGKASSPAAAELINNMNLNASQQQPTPASTPKTQQEFDAAWKTLKSGEKLTGPDGKVYTKG